MLSSFIAFRRIEASKDIAQTLSQSRNVTYLPSQNGGSNMLLGINAQ
jgi:prohibitin 1